MEEIRLATTRVVDQTVLTLESLEENATFINGSGAKIGIGVEHDRLCPPLGQLISADIVPIEDQCHALIGQFDRFSDPVQIRLPDGDIGFQQVSSKFCYPFVDTFHHPQSFCIATDSTGLGGFENNEAFFSALRSDSTVDFESQTTIRRSVLPDPEMVFMLGVKYSAAWLAIRLANVAVQVVEPELKAFLQILLDAVKNFDLQALPKLRPRTYVVQVHGTPRLEFVAKTRDASKAIEAFADGDFANLRPKIEVLTQRYDAEMIQLVMRDDGKWSFNYLLTRDGKVIGHKRAFDNRALLLNRGDAKAKPKKSKKRT